HCYRVRAECQHREGALALTIMGSRLAASSMDASFVRRTLSSSWSPRIEVGALSVSKDPRICKVANWIVGKYTIRRQDAVFLQSKCDGVGMYSGLAQRSGNRTIAAQYVQERPFL